MANGFRNLTVYKKIFDDYYERYKEIGQLLNYIPDKSGLEGINSFVFKLLTADCRL